MRYGCVKPRLYWWHLAGAILLFSADLRAQAQNPPAQPAGSLATAASQAGDNPTLEEYQARLRRHFALREYEQLLIVANEVDRFYPGQEIVALYRNLTLRKKDKTAEEADRPYRRLRDRPVELPAATPAPTPAPAKTRAEAKPAQPGRQESKNIAMAAPPAGVPIAPPSETIEKPIELEPVGSVPRTLSSPSSSPLSGFAENPVLLGGAAAALVLIALVVVAMRRRAAGAEQAEVKMYRPPAPAERRSKVIRTPREELAGPDFNARPPFKPAPPPPEPSFESSSFDESFAAPMSPPSGWEIEPESPTRQRESEIPEPGTLSFREPDTAKPPGAPARADLPMQPEKDRISIGGTSLPGSVPLDPMDLDLPKTPDEDVFAGTTLKTNARAPWETISDTDTDVRLLPAEPPNAAPPSELEPIELDEYAKAQPDLPGVSSPEAWETEPGYEKKPAKKSNGDEDTFIEIEREAEAAEDTQTSWNRGAEETVGMSHQELSQDPDLILPPPPGEQPIVQVFHQDETVRVNFEPMPEKDQRASEEKPAAVSAVADTNTAADLDARLLDPFERARQLGLDFFQEARWDQAVHHLSVAAALRPEAADVKEKLRQARRMRKS